MSAADHLAPLPPDARAATLRALDEISRPLSSLEMDEALIGILTRTERRALIRALRGWRIIAIESDRLTG